METHEIKNQFIEILEQVKQINGVSEESATQVASVILKEVGKDRRAELLTSAKLNNNGNYRNRNQPATYKQKNALRKFGIKYADDITKSEASELIDKAISESSSN